MSNPGSRNIAVSRCASQSNTTGRVAQSEPLWRRMIDIRRHSPVLLGLIGFGFFCRLAVAQPSYPLYCQGPLTTSAPTPPPTGPTTTPFIWASTGAGAQAPGQGQCAWADRAAEGRLALDVRSDSQQALNEWFKAKSQFPLALPTAPAAAGDVRPYRLEGARLVKVAGKTAAFIAYEVETPKLHMTPASLVVTRDSVAVASGGVQVDFKKVSFHYAAVQGYKVVTWSMHGLTYALVSQETNNTQRSCMVCHSAMRDRDLSHTPTPFHTHRDASESVLQ